MTKEKNIKIGRPKNRLTEEQIKQVEEWASTGVSCKSIAHGLGIGESTFQTYKREDEAISNAYKKGKAEGNYLAAFRLKEHIKNDTPSSLGAAIFRLKTQDEGWTTNRLLKLDITGISTPEEIISAGIDALAKGKITLQEASQIAALANIKANIKLGITLNEDNQIKSFSREELKEKLDISRELLALHDKIDNSKDKSVI